MDNANSNDYLEKIKIQVIENLKKTAFAPSVQMQDVPRDPLGGMTEEEEAELDDLDVDENKDTRHTKRRWDARVEKEGELEDSDDEEEAERHGVRAQNGALKRRNIMNYQNENAASDTEMSGVATPAEVDEAVAARASEANAAVNEEVMKNKQLSALAEEVGPSNAASKADSPKPVDTDGDIDMTEISAEAAPETEAVPAPSEPAVATPPLSPPVEEPPAATVEPPVEKPSDVEPTPAEPMVVEPTVKAEDAAVEKQEGEAERIKEDVTGEASAAIAEYSQS
jgi:histone deacetylase 1/2